jgi:TrkA domain protein
MNINVREQALPGIGQRYEVDLAPGRTFVVVAGRDGSRSIGVNDSSDDELITFTLTADQAVMIGALLLGARFSIDAGEHPAPEEIVIVETVPVPADAPSIGRRPSALFADHRDAAAVLGVIRDDTPEILEADADAPIAAGDRIAIAVRRGVAGEITRLVTG